MKSFKDLKSLSETAEAVMASTPFASDGMPAHAPNAYSETATLNNLLPQHIKNQLRFLRQSGTGIGRSHEKNIRDEEQIEDTFRPNRTVFPPTGTYNPYGPMDVTLPPLYRHGIK